MSFWFLPWHTIGKPDPKGLEQVRQMLDEIVTSATLSYSSHELEVAKEYYFSVAGRTYEDDTDFDQRMNNFLEWFIFDYRPEGEKPGAVFERYLSKIRDSLTQEEMLLKMEVSKHVHSLFLVKRCEDGWVKVKDIVGKKKYIVTSDDILEKGDLLESRIITMGGGCFFTKTHCLHPKPALPLIKRGIRKSNVGADFFLALQAMQLKWRRSRKINMENIYRF